MRSLSTWFSSLSVRTRLYGMAVSVSLLVLGQGALSAWELNQVANGIDAMTELTSLHVRVGECIEKSQDTQQKLRMILGMGDASIQGDYRVRREDLNDSLRQTREGTTDAESVAMLTKVEADLAALDKKADGYLQQLASGSLADSETAVDVLDELAAEGAASLRAVALRVKGQVAEALPRIAASTERPITIILGACIAIVLLASFGNWRQASALLRGISDILGGLQRLRDGKLKDRVEVRSGDEIGQMAKALNEALATMQDMLLAIKSESVQMESRSGTILGSSRTVSNNAVTCSNSLDEMSRRLGDVTTAIAQTSERTQTASKLAGDTEAATERAVAQMCDLTAAMTRIESASIDMAKTLDVINKIAFETNLLALNASVEAARAGDAGRGFSIVAQEVRNLANRCAEAASSTSTMIERAKDSANNGSSLANAANTCLTDIRNASVQVHSILTDIATAATAQASEISSVVDDAKRVQNVTDGNSASAEELASMASEGSDQSTTLQRLVGQFEV